MDLAQSRHISVPRVKSRRLRPEEDGPLGPIVTGSRGREAPVTFTVVPGFKGTMLVLKPCLGHRRGCGPGVLSVRAEC